MVMALSGLRAVEEEREEAVEATVSSPLRGPGPAAVLQGGGLPLAVEMRWGAAGWRGWGAGGHWGSLGPFPTRAVRAHTVLRLAYFQQMTVRRMDFSLSTVRLMKQIAAQSSNGSSHGAQSRGHPCPRSGSPGLWVCLHPSAPLSPGRWAVPVSWASTH